jgi:hypothetical protein
MPNTDKMGIPSDTPLAGNNGYSWTQEIKNESRTGVQPGIISQKADVIMAGIREAGGVVDDSFRGDIVIPLLIRAKSRAEGNNSGTPLVFKSSTDLGPNSRELFDTIVAEIPGKKADTFAKSLLECYQDVVDCFAEKRKENSESMTR